MNSPYRPWAMAAVITAAFALLWMLRKPSPVPQGWGVSFGRESSGFFFNIESGDDTEQPPFSDLEECPVED